MVSETTSMDLRGKTVKGVSWSAVSQIVTQGFTWAISIVLARVFAQTFTG
jgi:O-antigen/teichoic acid export membrane protein